MQPEEFTRLQKEIGWNNKVLASKLGIHEVTVCNYKKGGLSIPETIEKLIKFYHKEIIKILS